MQISIWYFIPIVCVCRSCDQIHIALAFRRHFQFHVNCKGSLWGSQADQSSTSKGLLSQWFDSRVPARSQPAEDPRRRPTSTYVKAGEREQVKVRAHIRTIVHYICARLCVNFSKVASCGTPVWVTLLKRGRNAISSRSITITKTVRAEGTASRGGVCVRARRPAGYIPGDLPHLHTTSSHPAKPMYAFSYLAPNKPFLRRG